MNPDSTAPGPANPGLGGVTSLKTSGLSKLNILQQRMKRLRAEKERLTKERGLEEVETALQKEIMADLRKQHGLRDGT
jgi:hypothetical protein